MQSYFSEDLELNHTMWWKLSVDCSEFWDSMVSAMTVAYLHLKCNKAEWRADFWPFSLSSPLRASIPVHHRQFIEFQCVHSNPGLHCTKSTISFLSSKSTKFWIKISLTQNWYIGIWTQDFQCASHATLEPNFQIFLTVVNFEMGCSFLPSWPVIAIILFATSQRVRITATGADLISSIFFKCICLPSLIEITWNWGALMYYVFFFL